MLGKYLYFIECSVVFGFHLGMRQNAFNSAKVESICLFHGTWKGAASLTTPCLIVKVHVFELYSLN